MIEKFCYWQFDDKEIIYCSENCKNLENFLCPYKIESVIKKNNAFLIEGCKEFIPLDNVRDYFKDNQNTKEA